MSHELDDLTKRVNELEARLRDQRSTAMFAAAGAAILLASGVWIGHALHADAVPAPAPASAPQPVVVTVSAPPAAAPLSTPIASTVVSEPNARPAASAPPPSAPVVPVTTTKRQNLDRGF